MFDWDFDVWGERWFIWSIIIIIAVILIDEYAYHLWKRANPGSLYSHLNDQKGLTPIDPSRPPTVYY